MKSPTARLKKRGGIINSLLYIILLPVYLLGRIFPRDKNLIAFGSGHGEHFMDNPKYLFLHCSKSLENSKCVFFSRKPEVVKRIKKAGYSARYTYSLKGFITALRAGQCFISHSTHDIHALLIGGADITQLWHGTPIKLICYDIIASERSPLKSFLKKLLFGTFPYLKTHLRFNRITISSEFTRKNFKTAFRADDNQFVITGQPRNDALTGDAAFDKTLFPEIDDLEMLRSEYDRIITWMPTHRLFSGRGTVGLLDDFGFDLTALSELLEKHNTLLVTKVHFLDQSALRERLRQSGRVRLYDYPDPYPLLRYSDIMITDYSSVIFDFLLLNRPIVFTPFDYEDYIRNDARFYYEYDEVTPGQRCGDWKEALAALEYHLTCFSEGREDRYSADRQQVRDRFNDFTSGFSQRVLDTIIAVGQTRNR